MDNPEAGSLPEMPPLFSEDLHIEVSYRDRVTERERGSVANFPIKLDETTSPGDLQIDSLALQLRIEYGKERSVWPADQGLLPRTTHDEWIGGGRRAYTGPCDF